MKQLHYNCKKSLNKLQPSQYLPDLTEFEEDEHLLSCCKNQPAAIRVFMHHFVDKSVPVDVHQAMASFLLLMSGDAALSSVLPFECHSIVEEIAEVWSRNGPIIHLVDQMKSFCPEFANLVKASALNDFMNCCLDFVLCVIEKVKAIHAINRPTPPPVPTVPYNPPSGVAYYFTKEGHQIRQQPMYDIPLKLNQPFDDIPQVEEVCNKQFPLVSRGGYGYMFIWFCPLHGHCYGFHLIKGGEGRKDPFSSLFKYLPEPPSHVFFDFACALSEYCLNREPEFFKNTRFWHDIFHSFPHKCGPNFRSVRIKGLEGVNSEICEQWNSYLQCIKYTASHLSQEHMMFFVQFLMYLKNMDKTKRFKSQAAIALAGLL